MESLYVKQKFKGIDVEAEFKNSLSLLSGDSGTGKTLLLKAVRLYCRNNNISCQYCDYNLEGKKSNQIITLCEGCDVVLFDNADLYLTDEIIHYFLNKGSIIIFSMKNTFGISTAGSSRFFVNFKNFKLQVEEV